MNKKIKILIISVSAATLILAVAAGFFAHSYATKSSANERFENELSTLNADNYKLEKKRSDLKDSVSEIETDIENKNEIGFEAQEYSNQLEAIKQELETSNETFTELNDSIEKKQEYIEKADSIKTLVEGDTFSITSETLDCSADISAGRYIARGSGNLLIYNSSDKLRISENLSTIDTNSFTFDITSGESVKVTETVTLTELR